jgi:hypothetical protein
MAQFWVRPSLSLPVTFGGGIRAWISLTRMTVSLFNNVSGQIVYEWTISLYNVIFTVPSPVIGTPVQFASAGPVCWIGACNYIHSDRRTCLLPRPRFDCESGTRCIILWCIFCVCGRGPDAEQDTGGIARDQRLSIELSFDSLLHVSRVMYMQPVCRIATKTTETRGLPFDG